MSSVPTAYKKFSVTATKQPLSRKSPLHLRRKKLIRLTTRLRREASRIRWRRVPPLWATARPYLRAYASLYPRPSQRHVFKLQHPRHSSRALRKLLTPHQPLNARVTLLASLPQQLLAAATPASAVTAAAEMKITSALLRRKRYRYKKLTYLFLKTRRLRWLQRSRQLKRAQLLQRKQLASEKLIAKKLTSKKPTAKKLTLTNKSRDKSGIIVIRSSLLHRRRSLRRLRRAATLMRRTLSAGTAHRKAKRCRLKTVKSSRRKLRLRRQLRRKYRKLRLKVSKRARARSRRIILTATKRYARQHFHYRRLLLSQRVGTATQLLRDLRQPLPTLVKGKLSATDIERSWRPKMRQRFFKKAVKGKTAARPIARPRTKATTKLKQPLLPTNRKKLLIRAIRKSTLSHRPQKVRATKARKGAIDTKSGAKNAAKSVSVARNLMRSARDTYLSLTQTALHTTAARLRAVKAHPVGVRREHALRAITLFTKSARRLKTVLRQWKYLSTKRPLIAITNRLTSIERRRIFIRTTRGARSTRAHRLLPKHSSLPRPALRAAISRTPVRKSQRHKRGVVRRRRALVAKSKRKLRRRSRRKVITVHKRRYPTTERSPTHAGRAVPWKKKEAHRPTLHRRIALTRTLFKELLRVERPKLTASRSTRPSGRSFLQALLRVISDQQSAKQATRLAVVIRLFLQRNSLPTVSAVRLLLLKAASLPTIGANPMKKAQLLMLERSWLFSASTAPLLRKSTRTHSRKQRTARPRIRKRSSSATLRANRFLTTYPNRVKSLLARRKFATRILRLKPKRLRLRRRTKQRKAVKRFKKAKRSTRAKRFSRPRRPSRAKRRYVKSRRNWLRLRQYRRVRQFAAYRIATRLRARTRFGGRQKIRSYLLPNAQKLQRGTIRRQELTPTVAHRHLATIKSTLHLATLLQQRRLQSKKQLLLSHLHHKARTPSAQLRSRLDSIRLRTRKTLLWKARVRAYPAAVEPRSAKVTRWYTRHQVAHQAVFQKHVQQELRRSVPLTPTPANSSQPAVPLPTPWLRFRFQVGQHTSAQPLKKFQPRGRLQRISRFALRPKRLHYWAVVPRALRKKKEALKARAHRVHAFRRSIFFRKNRFFMRRKTTRGYKENLLGKLTPLRGFRGFAERPLRVRMRRSRPLRRSIRRQLAIRRTHRHKRARTHRQRTSTGRILSTHIRKMRYNVKTPWGLKKRIKVADTVHNAITKKVQIVDRLLKQFAHLTALRSTLLPPVQKAPALRPLPRTSRILRKAAARSRLRVQIRTVRRRAFHIPLLLSAHRRSTKLHQLRSWTSARTALTSWQHTTLQYSGLRRNLWLDPRRMTLRLAHCIWPGKTPGKYRWLLRTHRRRRNRRVLAPVTNRYRPTIVAQPKRLSLLNRKRLTTAVRRQSKKLPSRPQRKAVTKAQSPAPVTTNNKAAPRKLTTVAPKTSTPKFKVAPATTTVAKTPAPIALSKTPTPAAAVKPVLFAPAALSEPFAKKIAAFNREATLSEKAYTTLMSGLKGSLTALEKADTKTRIQAEADALFMEKTFISVYGPVPHFDKTALLSFTKYTEKHITTSRNK